MLIFGNAQRKIAACGRWISAHASFPRDTAEEESKAVCRTATSLFYTSEFCIQNVHGGKEPEILQLSNRFDSFVDLMPASAKKQIGSNFFLSKTD